MGNNQLSSFSQFLPQAPYLGFHDALATHLPLSSEIFFLCHFLLQIYSCLPPWVFFFPHINILFPLVAFKESPQKSTPRLKLLPNLCWLFFCPSNWRKTGRGGARDKGVLLVGGAVIYLLSKPFAKSSVVLGGMLYPLLRCPKGSLIMDSW